MVEIHYGAVDAEGNGIWPDRDDNDTAGTWTALEKDGQYWLISWKKPAAEGGEIIYGEGFTEKGLTLLEDVLQAKKDIIKQAETLTRNSRTADQQEQIEALAAQLDELFSWDTPAEKELENRFAAASQKASVRREQQSAAAQAKAALIEQAKALSNSQEWKKTGEAMKGLMEEWKKLGNAGADNNALWKDFSDARQAFYDRRSEHFAQLDASREAAAAAKARIIEQTRAITAEPGNWKDAAAQLNTMMDAWKEAGSAGHDKDEALWQEFSALRRDFYDRRHEFLQAMDEKRNAAFAAKQAILEQARALVEAQDYSQETATALRELQAHWKEAGSAGKEHDDTLWEEFHSLQDQFWSVKKAQLDQRHSEWQKKQEDWKQRMNGVLTAKRQQVKNLQEQNKKLTERVNTCFNLDTIARLTEYINQNKENIEKLRKDITDIETKLRDAK